MRSHPSRHRWSARRHKTTQSAPGRPRTLQCDPRHPHATQDAPRRPRTSWPTRDAGDDRHRSVAVLSLTVNFGPLQGKQVSQTAAAPTTGIPPPGLRSAAAAEAGTGRRSSHAGSVGRRQLTHFSVSIHSLLNAPGGSTGRARSSVGGGCPAGPVAAQNTKSAPAMSMAQRNLSRCVLL